MSRLLNYILRRPQSAQVAKDRLQIIIAQERHQANSPDYLKLLQQEIIDVIVKYTNISKEQVGVDCQYNDNNAVLELNVTLPNEESVTAPKEETVTQ